MRRQQIKNNSKLVGDYMISELTIKEQRDLFKKALLVACKYCREHPPAALPSSTEEIYLLVGGASDEKGIAYLKYFLEKAQEQLRTQ